MPDQEGLIAIQNLRDLAASVRRGGQVRAQGQQNALNFTAQQQLQEQARERQLSDIQQAQLFRSAEREAGQTFQSGQQAQRLLSQERQAETRGANVEIKVNTQNARATREAEANQSFERAGIVEADDAGNLAINLERLGTASGQARLLFEQILNFQEKSEEEFKAVRGDENKRFELLRKEAKRGKVTEFLPNSMKIKANETAEGYVKRLTGLRKNLVRREIDRRLDKEDFTKEVTSAGLGGVQTRTATATERATQRARVEGRISEEVIEEFGGDIGLE